MAEESSVKGLEGWQRLHLEGRKFLIARADVDLERWPGEGRMRCRSVLSLLGSDREHVAYAWSPGAHERRAWVEVSEGRKIRAAYRLPDDALEVRRYKPGDEGEWDDLRVETVSLAPSDRSLRDAWYALVELSALAGEGPHRVLTKDGPIELRVRSSKAEPTTLRIDDLERGERVHVAVELIELELTRADGQGETLLGLSGPTVLVIDRRSGALIEARGEKEGVPGTIRLRLTGFSREPSTWRDAPLPEDARRRLAELDPAPASP